MEIVLKWLNQYDQFVFSNLLTLFKRNRIVWKSSWNSFVDLVLWKDQSIVQESVLCQWNNIGIDWFDCFNSSLIKDNLQKENNFE